MVSTVRAAQRYTSCCRCLGVYICMCDCVCVSVRVRMSEHTLLQLLQLLQWWWCCKDCWHQKSAATNKVACTHSPIFAARYIFQLSCTVHGEASRRVLCPRPPSLHCSPAGVCVCVCVCCVHVVHNVCMCVPTKKS